MKDEFVTAEAELRSDPRYLGLSVISEQGDCLYQDVFENGSKQAKQTIHGFLQISEHADKSTVDALQRVQSLAKTNDVAWHVSEQAKTETYQGAVTSVQTHFEDLYLTKYFACSGALVETLDTVARAPEEKTNGTASSNFPFDVLPQKLVEPLTDELSKTLIFVAKQSDEIAAIAENIAEGFKRVQSEPVNMRILSGRLDGSGAALSTISQNYDKMAEEMVEMVSRLKNAEGGAIAEIVEHTKAAQWEMLFTKSGDIPSFSGAHSFDAKQHEQVMVNVGKNVRVRIAKVNKIAKEIPSTCRQIRRRINGLDVVKLLCRVESGRLAVVDGGLNGIIDRLEAFHNETDKNLADLTSFASQIVSKTTSNRCDTKL